MNLKLIIKAILHFAEYIKKKSLERKLKAGYIANKDYYLKSIEEWKYVERI
jgi:hypothetical protein